MVFALPRNENSLAVNSKRAVIIHPQHQTALRRFPRAERINDNPPVPAAAERPGLFVKRDRHTSGRCERIIRQRIRMTLNLLIFHKIQIIDD